MKCLQLMGSTCRRRGSKVHLPEWRPPPPPGVYCPVQTAPAPAFGPDPEPPAPSAVVDLPPRRRPPAAPPALPPSPPPPSVSPTLPGRRAGPALGGGAGVGRVGMPALGGGAGMRDRRYLCVARKGAVTPRPVPPIPPPRGVLPSAGRLQRHSDYGSPDQARPGFSGQARPGFPGQARSGSLDYHQRVSIRVTCLPAPPTSPPRRVAPSRHLGPGKRHLRAFLGAAAGPQAGRPGNYPSRLSGRDGRKHRRRPERTGGPFRFGRGRRRLRQTTAPRHLSRRGRHPSRHDSRVLPVWAAAGGACAQAQAPRPAVPAGPPRISGPRDDTNFAGLFLSTFAGGPSPKLSQLAGMLFPSAPYSL